MTISPVTHLKPESVKAVKAAKFPPPWEVWTSHREVLVGPMGPNLTEKNHLAGGWTNPLEKYARQIGSSPQGSGWK